MLDFHPNATQFDIVNSYYLAMCCSVAYADLPGEDANADQVGLIDYKPFADLSFGPAKGVRCFVGTRPGPDNAVVLAFKGTSDIQGWLTDGDIPQIPDVRAGSGGSVHRGFANGLNLIWDAVRAALPKKGVAPLWITGHSLGGALAVLAANWLCADPAYEVAGAYTYGCPRVGNLGFYQTYKAIHFRHVNNEDIVPHVPPELAVVGLHFYTYKHVGSLKYFDRHGQLNEGTNDWTEKKNIMLATLADFGHPTLNQWPGPIRDHLIASYLATIAKNLPAPPAVPPPPKPSDADVAAQFAAVGLPQTSPGAVAAVAVAAHAATVPVA